jgi:phage I-like protein
MIACGGGGATKLTPGGALPNELVLCPWGTTQTRKGTFAVNAYTLSVFAARQAAMRRDMVAGDFEHGTLTKTEPVRVGCYAVPRVVDGVGIVCRVNHWTTDGKEYVAGGHYPDISPALEVDKEGNVIGLHSFAFCRHGEIQSPDLQIFSADQSQPQPMNLLTLLNAVLAALAIEPVKQDATAEDMAAVLAKAEAAAKAKTGEMETVELTAEQTALLPLRAGRLRQAGSVELIGDQVAPIMAEVQRLSAAVVALTAADKTRQIDGMIEAAKAKGQAIGLRRETLLAMGADAVGEYLATLEENAIPLQGGNGGAKGGAESGADVKVEAFSAEQKAMFARMGMTADEVAKAAEEMHGIKIAV